MHSTSKRSCAKCRTCKLWLHSHLSLAVCWMRLLHFPNTQPFFRNAAVEHKTLPTRKLRSKIFETSDKCVESCRYSLPVCEHMLTFSHIITPSSHKNSPALRIGGALTQNALSHPPIMRSDKSRIQKGGSPTSDIAHFKFRCRNNSLLRTRVDVITGHGKSVGVSFRR